MMACHAAVWSYAKVVSAMDNGAGNVFTAVVSWAVPGQGLRLACSDSWWRCLHLLLPSTVACSLLQP